jgi:hypothetical protein
MKTLRFRLVQMAALCFLIWLPDTASASSSFYISFGSGRQYSRRSHRHDRKQRSHRSNRHHRNFRPVNNRWRSHYYRPYGSTIVFGSGVYYRTEPYYVVTTSPTIVEKRVIVVEPDKCDASTELLLDRLAMGNKFQRLEAIELLAESSFNDRVRQALENVLLSDPDPQLRKEVAHIFGVVRNTEALPALEKARVEDSDEDVRKEADYAIEKIKDNGH